MSLFIDYQHPYVLTVSSTLSGLGVPLHTQEEFEILTYWAPFKGNNKKIYMCIFLKAAKLKTNAAFKTAQSLKMSVLTLETRQMELLNNCNARGAYS